jgi:penicillin-binding protein 1B
MEGAHSALPIWTEFMKKAKELYPPRDLEAMHFAAPEGVVFENVEPDTSEMPIKGCDMGYAPYTESFLAGSVDGTVHCGAAPEDPVSTFFDKVGGGIGGFFGRIFGKGGKSTEPSDKRAEPSTSSH